MMRVSHRDSPLRSPAAAAGKRLHDVKALQGRGCRLLSPGQLQPEWQATASAASLALGSRRGYVAPVTSFAKLFFAPLPKRV